jgi:hypothetical protein
MGIANEIQEMAIKVRTQKASIATEEATKNAFVMPFISTVLGYDVFNPSEVIPEFIADVGIKKGEKIDYALVHNGEVQILIEVKKVTEPLDVRHAYQLFRYFATTKSRVAILTNGETYEFFTDLDAPNVMDSKPFLVLDLTAVDETLLPEVAKLTKESFDLDFLRLFATHIYPGKSFTQRMREELSPLVAKATAQFLNEQARERLKTALEDDGKTAEDDVKDAAQTLPSNPAPEDDLQGDIFTTDQELEGYRIVRAIVCSEVSANRVIGRDSKTYFAVILDNNNRKPIARLWFNRKQMYLGVFSVDKAESRLPIESPEDIYHYAAQLRATVKGYLTTDPSGSAVETFSASSMSAWSPESAEI